MYRMACIVALSQKSSHLPKPVRDRSPHNTARARSHQHSEKSIATTKNSTACAIEWANSARFESLAQPRQAWQKKHSIYWMLVVSRSDA
jgi:hypothetical protein